MQQCPCGTATSSPRFARTLYARWFLLRRQPLAVKEPARRTSAGLGDLLKLGGFPEPFLSGSEVEARGWAREYRNRLVREEVAGLERIQDLGNLELLALRLP